MYLDSLNSATNENAVFSGFNSIFTAAVDISNPDNRLVQFPNGFVYNDATPANNDYNICCKFLFTTAHNSSNGTNHLTVNNKVVVANINGTLTPLPIHELTTGTYSILQANTILEVYLTSNYDGNGNAAWVVVGNPIVLSGSGYTIYANGYIVQQGELPESTLSRPTFTFPIPFKTIPVFLRFMNSSYDKSFSPEYFGFNITPTSVQYYISSSTAPRGYYYACGY